MKQHKYKVNAYSLMAGAFLFVSQELESQIVYLDIDPDTLIQFEEDKFKLDLDDDGIFDVQFNKGVVGYYWTSLIQCFSTVYIAGREPLDNNLYFIGKSISWGNDHIYALDFGYLIGNSAQLNADGWEFMVEKRREVTCSWMGSVLGPWVGVVGMSWDGDLDPSDNYVGVKFVGGDDCFHYGWIRCTITDTLEKLTIKDYAYNAECEKGIYAGQLVSGVETTENLAGVNIYSFGQSVFVHIGKEDIGSALKIFSVTGDLILESELTGIANKFTLFEMPKGIYLVEVYTDKGIAVKKIVIQ